MARRGESLIGRTPAAARRFFERRYREAGSPTRAAAGKAYLKSELRFYGATVPEIRRAANDFAREHRDLSRAELQRIVDELWSTDVYELRPAGIALLSRHATLLEERDLPWLHRLRAALEDLGVRRLARRGGDRRLGGGVAAGPAAFAGLGARRQLLGAPHRVSCAAAPAESRGRRLRDLRATRRGHAARARVLHP